MKEIIHRNITDCQCEGRVLIVTGVKVVEYENEKSGFRAKKSRGWYNVGFQGCLDEIVIQNAANEEWELSCSDEEHARMSSLNEALAALGRHLSPDGHAFEQFDCWNITIGAARPMLLDLLKEGIKEPRERASHSHSKEAEEVNMCAALQSFKSASVACITENQVRDIYNQKPLPEKEWKQITAPY